MGAEIGATTSLFPYDEHTAAYLKATRREELADAANRGRGDLRADPEVEADPERYFDQVIEIDLSTLAPLINGPDTPDLAHEVGEVGAWARANGVPDRDLDRARSARAPTRRTRTSRAPRRSPGTRPRTVCAPRRSCSSRPARSRCAATIERDGLLADLEAIGATVLANACGPCIGQWDRPGVDESKLNTIVTSYNRNFSKRNDGRAVTKAFVTSPETVMALALAGTLDFDPRTDDDRRRPPRRADRARPARARVRPGRIGIRRAARRRDRRGGRGRSGQRAPAAAHAVPGVGRRRLPRPARAAEGEGQVHDRPDLRGREVAAVPRSPRADLGQPLRGRDQRVHGSASARGKDPLDGETRAVPRHRASTSREAGVPWCAVGDANYGEGSSREHAAMEPRYRGGVVIFAAQLRPHPRDQPEEAGHPAAHVRRPVDLRRDRRATTASRCSTSRRSRPIAPVRCRITKPDGATVDFACTHTFSAEQIEWFAAGGALNIIRRRRR